jgi:hypothetical protein
VGGGGEGKGGGGGGEGEGELTTCHPSCERRRRLRSAEASTGRSCRRSSADVAVAVMGGVEEEEEARRSQLQSRCSCAACPGLVATMLGQALTSRSHGVPRLSSTKS